MPVGMENEDRATLRNKRMLLAEHMDNSVVTKHLLDSKVLSTTDSELLASLPSNVKRNERLLDLLPKRGSKAFRELVRVLEMNKMVHLLGPSYIATSMNGDEKGKKMNEEKPGDKHSLNGIGKDISSDVPVPMDISRQPSNIDVDVTRDPTSEKQLKLDEQRHYDLVDTPKVLPSRTNSAFPQLSDASAGCGMERQKQDFTDLTGGDATDSGGHSVSSNENADGCFKSEKDAGSPYGVPYSIVTHDDSFSYPMKSTPRGYFLIVNNRDFLYESGMQPYTRKGTDEDAKQMASLFTDLGFTVTVHKNLKCKEMLQAVDGLVRMNHTSVSAVGCCFLSHGEEKVLYGTDGKLEIQDITSAFRKNPQLVGKPKMFFFQACQGSDYMNSVDAPLGCNEVDGPGALQGNHISLPEEADFLYAYSTVPGYYSWRNSQKGSWFVQAIVKVFRQYAHKLDVVRMLTRVNHEVCTNKSQTGQAQSHNKRQVCSIITQLRYELYLYPNTAPLPANNGCLSELTEM